MLLFVVDVQLIIMHPNRNLKERLELGSSHV